ncbi:AtpZ/AtpI family protein [Chitinophagaceae bacterium MMS25-I14]
MTDDRKKYQDAMKYAGLATQWLVLLLLAVWGGMKLDKLTGWKFPLFTVLLPLLALCVSLWQLIKSLNKPGK